ncbi:CAAD domain-containing protein [Synechococcus sp. CBW1108]|uniref:CAAD domain-containing protein n=1 Tax=Synechococcus sp. CBW1108 TaxID=1353147 RepID=UPI0018CE993B|nr:CAAD domain-containing protein [Synechococcus sp. CBW1108]QPN70246.1 CAAD domain-containing protein [Synechococcus sp. CBW1108]
MTPEVLELPAEQILEAIPQASPAPLAPAPTSPSPPAAEPGLPLQFLNQLLQKLGAARLQSLADLLPAARILLLAGLAGMALRLTGATLGAINEIPLLGGLLELVGLVTLLNFLARNAFKQQKRAELLERIRKLRNDLLA